jgi:hypothetical protein
MLAEMNRGNELFDDPLHVEEPGTAQGEVNLHAMTREALSNASEVTREALSNQTQMRLT